MAEVMIPVGDDLTDLLPESLKGHVSVSSVNMSMYALRHIGIALGYAASRIAPVIRTPARAVLIVAKPPFRIDMSHAELRFTPKDDTPGHFCADQIVFLDGEWLLTLPFPFRVATILEELVHVLLDVGDEDLVKFIVARLYDGVRWENGLYHVVEGAPEPDTDDAGGEVETE